MISSLILVFLSQNTQNQGVDAPRRSYSAAKSRNTEFECSGAKPKRAGAFAHFILRYRSLVWNNQTTITNALSETRKGASTSISELIKGSIL